MDHLIQFANNHWQLCLAFVVILLIIFINEYYSLQQQGKTVTTEAAVALINHDDAVVFDLRSADLFKSGHIIHSIRVSKTDFDQPKMDKYKNKPIILVCARGIESAALATALRKKGYTQPMVLAGGFNAWQTATLPVVKK
ncbi:MAG: rhodanese-like domain-containing protein [Legionellaceae bacterium]|nr:rhodanese-like domain-containing protein [Legionellaceae bacterium]